MELNFVVEGGAAQALKVDLTELVVAGWAGRDRAAIEHHIEEARRHRRAAPEHRTALLSRRREPGDAGRPHPGARG